MSKLLHPIEIGTRAYWRETLGHSRTLLWPVTIERVSKAGNHVQVTLAASPGLRWVTIEHMEVWP
jgi:hypothetical protein